MARTVPHPYNLCSWIEIVLKCSKDSHFSISADKNKRHFFESIFFFYIKEQFVQNDRKRNPVINVCKKCYFNNKTLSTNITQKMYTQLHYLHFLFYKIIAH